MKSTEHGQHVIKLTQFGVVNCYLVRETDGFTLIDAGVSKKAAPIVSAAAQHGVPITTLALTHAHSDHVGALHGLVEQLPDAELLVGEREAAIMAGDKSLRPGEATGAIKGGYPKGAPAPTRLLAPGDRVGSLEVIATPGHTPGHIAFVDVRDRSVIAGDALQTQGGIAVAGIVKPLFPLPGMASWDLATGLESAVALRALDPSRLAVGHGKVIEQPGEALDGAIAAAAKKVKAGDPPPPPPAAAG